MHNLGIVQFCSRDAACPEMVCKPLLRPQDLAMNLSGGLCYTPRVGVAKMIVMMILSGYQSDADLHHEFCHSKILRSENELKLKRCDMRFQPRVKDCRRIKDDFREGPSDEFAAASSARCIAVA